jgi:hypothetical protein
VPVETLRVALMGVIFLLPRARQKRIERWLRGREEYLKTQGADWLLLSWGKSGRTWLRVMLSRFYQQRFALPEHRMLGYDNLQRLNKGIPKVFFTHGNYLRDYTGHGYDTKVDFAGRRIVLLVRDPRDVAVSQFFQWKFRMRPRKRWINDYPCHDESLSMFDFLMNEEQGLPRVISYFNGWLAGIHDRDDVLVVRYEDLRTETARVLGEILAFTGLPATPAELQDAVDYAAFDNLKKLESQKSFSLLRTGWRLLPGDRSNPDSYKVRRGKVGGWRDYFETEQCERIDAIVEAGLLPGLGYTAAEQSAVGAVKAEASDQAASGSTGTLASTSEASGRR